MNKLRNIKVYETLTLDKLPEITGISFRLYDGCQELHFLKLAESLRSWTDCNAKAMHSSEKHEKYKRENIFQIKGRECKNLESNPKTNVSNAVRNQEIKPLSVGQSIGRSNKG